MAGRSAVVSAAAFALVCAVVVAAGTATPGPGTAPTWRPVALMHGLMASAEAMSHAAKWIEADYPGIHILNVEVGNGKEDSLLMDMNKQVDVFAQAIRADPAMAQGFNVIAHSQGGFLARGYVERYNDPPVHNLITWATPHDGQYGVPDFNIPFLDKLMSDVVDGGWQSKLVQETISFASYWKDPYNYTAYLENNIFLADLNNERPEKNATYKERMTSLNTVLLVDSVVDKIVVPYSSPWFQFFYLNQSTNVQPFNQTPAYVGDWLGMRTLNEAGKVQLRQTNCPHQDLPRNVCKKWYDLYTQPLLNNTLP